MIEIFNKRWQTLDLISMMQELKRTEATNPWYDVHRDFIFYQGQFVFASDISEKGKGTFLVNEIYCLFERLATTDSKLASCLKLFTCSGHRQCDSDDP